MGKNPKPRLRNFRNYSEYIEALNEWRRATNNWSVEAETEESASRSGGHQRTEGSTMYNRRSRSGHEPTGASGHHNFRGPQAGKGHSTQYYEDDYRLSRNTDGQGDRDVHWTNQSASKGSSQRHEPPNDAQESE